MGTMSDHVDEIVERPRRLLVALFLTVGVLGVCVMIGSLIVAFFIPQKDTGLTGLQMILNPDSRVLMPVPTPTPSEAEDDGLPPLTMKNYDYKFTKHTELKDFKVKGPGTIAINKGRLQLKTTPGRTITVTRTFRLLSPATIDLEVQASSEPSYDVGRVSLDGWPLISSVSGDSGGIYSKQLEGGLHTLTFTYTKDWDVAQGDDAFYITKLHLPMVGTGGWA
jgi:hypothetical protein